MFILLNLFYLPPFYHDTFTINILTLGAAYQSVPLFFAIYILLINTDFILNLGYSLTNYTWHTGNF